MPDDSTDEDCEAACADCLDTMIGSTLDTGWKLVEDEMNGKIWAQVGWVAYYEAQAVVPDPYAWPRAPEPTDEQLAEHRRLLDVADASFARAKEMGFEETGIDAVFG